MSDFLSKPRGLFADLGDSIEYTLAVYELKIHCLSAWDDISPVEKGEILFLIDKAKAFSEGLESEKPTAGGEFAWTMIELGNLIGNQEAKYAQSLAKANSQQPLTNVNNNWRAIKAMLGIQLEVRARELWIRDGEIKLEPMARRLSEEDSLALVEKIWALSESIHNRWMIPALNLRLPKDKPISIELIKKLLKERNKIDPTLIPPPALKPGRPKTTKT